MRFPRFSLLAFGSLLVFSHALPLRADEVTWVRDPNDPPGLFLEGPWDPHVPTPQDVAVFPGGGLEKAFSRQIHSGKKLVAVKFEC